jgi:membrane-associated phospholipid phosphatase
VTRGAGVPVSGALELRSVSSVRFGMGDKSSKSRTKREPTDPEKADIAVARAAAPMRRHKAVKALGWVSEAADQPPLMTLCAATLAAGLIMRKGRLARAGARMLAAEVVATQIKSLIKHRIDRTRPRVVTDGGRYQAHKGHDHASEMNSFPSGHTAGAVAVARAYARDYPEHSTGAYAAAAGVGAIQIPRSAHYPTDIAAGAVIGVLAEALVDWTEGLTRATIQAYRGSGRLRPEPARVGVDGICTSGGMPRLADAILHRPAERPGGDDGRGHTDSAFGNGADDRALDPAIAILTIDRGADQRTQ